MRKHVSLLQRERKTMNQWDGDEPVRLTFPDYKALIKS